MSSNKTNSGFFAQLKNPIIDSERREELNEDWYDREVNLSINYEGTLVYSADDAGDEYGLTFTDKGDDQVMSGRGKFLEDLKKEGIEILPERVRGYVCTWYNGSDSDMDMMTLETFLK